MASLPDANASTSKYGPQATRLYHAREYVQKQAAPDFWALIPYYLPQFNGRACSVASVAMVVNGARAGSPLTAADELVTQEGLLKKVNSSTWKKAVGDKGKGVSLDELGQLTKKSLEAYGFDKVTVEVVHAGTPEFNAALREALVSNEKSEKDFMIINFLQSEYTGDPEGAVGHIAPVAGYDAAKKRVLVLDPDRQYYEPYWVSEETLAKGMTTKDSTSTQYRGYVYVRIGD